ncbi:uncharacterized protein TrAtP1_000057 [Trichoderma atroviride]|uniref:uncharacterized protein n=1 Tax=Hypocrea atroviridis TaxID=63577 RepID=UPI0033335612|nr:hypothetical protein TrAtP1_000057 [Trichoderma atroviride]
MIINRGASTITVFGLCDANTAIIPACFHNDILIVASSALPKNLHLVGLILHKVEESKLGYGTGRGPDRLPFEPDIPDGELGAVLHPTSLVFKAKKIPEGIKVLEDHPFKTVAAMYAGLQYTTTGW